MNPLKRVFNQTEQIYYTGAQKEREQGPAKKISFITDDLALSPETTLQN